MILVYSVSAIFFLSFHFSLFLWSSKLWADSRVSVSITVVSVSPHFLLHRATAAGTGGAAASSTTYPQQGAHLHTYIHTCMEFGYYLGYIVACSSCVPVCFKDAHFGIFWVAVNPYYANDVYRCHKFVCAKQRMTCILIIAMATDSSKLSWTLL